MLFGKRSGPAPPPPQRPPLSPEFNQPYQMKTQPSAVQIAQPQQAQPAAPRRVGADGLEQFDFNG
jgi:hypothetical protein